MCVDPASGRLLAGNRDMEAPEFIEALIRVAADVGTKVESYDAPMRNYRHGIKSRLRKATTK